MLGCFLSLFKSVDGHLEELWKVIQEFWSLYLSKLCKMSASEQGSLNRRVFLGPESLAGWTF